MNVLLDLVRMMASALVNQEVDIDVNASTVSAVLTVKQPQVIIINLFFTRHPCQCGVNPD